ncbi:polysaccharide biosynthesis/export family protein [Rhizobium sp. R693]|uniref:polysaccharide biosynthesis/export family protein n=1 Tax=Rhizobium sp. R693 TaxID=1764276 RepID=UPI001FD8DD59|nr:polysaccharide biosynthesis/export family protein [Rhizobium sp. R693]
MFLAAQNQIQSRPLKSAICIIPMLAMLLSSTSVIAQPQQYKVTSGDVLSVVAYGDPQLTGLFPVSPDGTIGYPILGNIEVTNKTTEEIGAAINASLREHVANLSVAVSVKEYAPVFILGDVKNPGKYEFRPGMIALEVFALGGGLRQSERALDASGVQLVAAQQDYDDTALQLLSQDVRRVRLEAEIDGKPFEYAADAASTGVRDAATIQSVIAAERNLFELRLSTLENDRRNLEAQGHNYEEEITMLEKSSGLRNEQFNLTQLDVEASQGLVSRGAAPEAALREKKRDLLAMNQQVLEAGSFLARARQNKNEVERRIRELDDRRKNDAAGELVKITVDTLRLKKKMTAIVQTMAEIGAAAQRVSRLEETVRMKFSVVRTVDGGYKEIPIDEHAAVGAGDIIRVELVPAVQAIASQSGTEN